MTKAEWIIWWIIVVAIVTLVVLTVAGCASSIKWQNDPNEPVYHLTGKAAEKMVEALANNALTSAGRASAVLKHNGWLYVGLVILMVGGFIFWGFTRSRFGWVIPAAAAGGIGFITWWARYAEWISLGVTVVAVGVLVWKCINYQQERNKNGEIIKGLKNENN